MWNTLKNYLLFFSRYLMHPRRVGAIAPSSIYLVSSLIRSIDKQALANLVEVGPGSGKITEYIKNFNPILVEIDEELCRLLRQKYPHLPIVNSCVLEWLNSLSTPINLLISIPLINNPIRNNVISKISELLEKKLILSCVTYTYGLSDPLRGCPFTERIRVKLVIRNIPPAFIWKYYC